MEWKTRLEAKTGWGEVTLREIGSLHPSLGDLTADGVGLGFAEAEALLAELRQRIVQSQIGSTSWKRALPASATAAWRRGSSARC